MERIVLGYDGSPASVAALSWVTARAARGDVQVDVINVVSRHSNDRSDALDRLGDAEDFLRERIPYLKVELHRLQGSVLETIPEFADDADLLVVGINVGHPLRAALAGGLPLRLTTVSRVPVCLVPAGWAEGEEPITVGIADDTSSLPALAFAAAEAHATGSTLRLVHAWLMPTPAFTTGSVVVDPLPEPVIQEHRRIVDTAVRWVAERYPTVAVETELVRDSRAAALLRFAGRSSLLALGTHQTGLLTGGILGSVAQDVLWHAECPVCVVPAHPRAGSGAPARHHGAVV
ncbi:universal stress protein [Microbacterium sp. X-17]|uniref:universal stress protein n=1 Tax=Microbacterium sp. X-17 TaxID=3144404 RepID=UPI0031F4B228